MTAASGRTPLANRKNAQVIALWERAIGSGVHRLCRVKVYTTAIFQVDSLEMRGLCFLYADYSISNTAKMENPVGWIFRCREHEYEAYGDWQAGYE